MYGLYGSKCATDNKRVSLLLHEGDPVSYKGTTKVMIYMCFDCIMDIFQALLIGEIESLLGCKESFVHK